MKKKIVITGGTERFGNQLRHTRIKNGQKSIMIPTQEKKHLVQKL